MLLVTLAAIPFGSDAVQGNPGGNMEERQFDRPRLYPVIDTNVIRVVTVKTSR